MDRPIIKITLNNKYKIIHYCTFYFLFVILLTNGIECALNYNVVEDFLPKYKMLFLSVFAIIMILGSGYLRKHPQHFNYRKPITEENAKEEYTKSTNAIIVLMFIALLSFTVISISHLLNRTQQIVSSINWSLYPAIISVCFAYFLVLYIKAYQKDKLNNKK